MQNVLKRKNMNMEGFQFIFIFFPSIYILDHSESVDMHIEKLF